MRSKMLKDVAPIDSIELANVTHIRQAGNDVRIVRRINVKTNFLVSFKEIMDRLFAAANMQD